MEENLDEPEVTTLKKIVEDLQMNLKDPTNSMGLDT